MNKQAVLIILIAFLAGGCRFLNPSRMLWAPKDYKYDTPPASTTDGQFRLQPNDEFTLLLFTNDGFKLLDISTSEGISTAQLGANTTYKVEYDGTVKFPVLGRVPMTGLTEREAEIKLEEMFMTYYIKPFVMLRVSNRKVTVFPGTDGAAKVVKLTDDNTNLLQVLAQTGGIPRTGRAYNIKVIRGELKNPKVYHFNLRELSNIKEADFVVQSNDIIYVEPSPQYARAVLTEITPYLTLVTTLLLVYNLVKQ